MINCGSCGCALLRTFSKYVNGHWEWWRGCNQCSWEARDTDEEKNHPECYTRTDTSPAMISETDVIVKP